MDRLHKEAAARHATTTELDRLQREAAVGQATATNVDTSKMEQKISLLEQQVRIGGYFFKYLGFFSKRLFFSNTHNDNAN
jgi:hypothetical protein